MASIFPHFFRLSFVISPRTGIDLLLGTETRSSSPKCTCRSPNPLGKYVMKTMAAFPFAVSVQKRVSVNSNAVCQVEVNHLASIQSPLEPKRSAFRACRGLGPFRVGGLCRGRRAFLFLQFVCNVPPFLVTIAV